MALDINIIVREGTSKDNQNQVPQSQAMPTEDDKQDAQNEANEKTATTMVLANYALSIAKSAARQTFNYFISDIGRANGDSNYQAIVNREIEKATDVLGFGASIAAGAKLGSAGGPWGTVIGAALGAVASGLSIGFRQLNRERDYAYQRFSDSNNQAYQLARANYSAYTGRLR